MPKKKQSKLTSAQMSHIMECLESLGDSLLCSIREQLVAQIPPRITNDELFDALVKMAYDKPKALARMILDGMVATREMPIVLEREKIRKQAYAELEGAMGSMRAVLAQELQDIKSKMLWETYSESPLDVYMDDIRGLFIQEEEADED